MFDLSSLAPGFSAIFRQENEKSASASAVVASDGESLRGTDASSARARSDIAHASGSARVDDSVEPSGSDLEASAPFQEHVERELVLDSGHAEAFQLIARRAGPEKSCCARRCAEKLERMHEGFTRETLELLAIAREDAHGPEVPGIQRERRRIRLNVLQQVMNQGDIQSVRMNHFHDFVRALIERSAQSLERESTSLLRQISVVSLTSGDFADSRWNIGRIDVS